MLKLYKSINRQFGVEKASYKWYNDTMNIKINRNSETPVFLQIKGKIKNLIVSEELPSGYKMPAERKLAEELGVHRNTVVKAYGELISEGYLTASRKAPKGYFVKMPDENSSFVKRFFPLEKMIQYNFNDKEKMFLNLFTQSTADELLSFGGIIMDKRTMPVKGMEDIFMRTFHVMQQTDRSNEREESERMKQNICRVLARENMYVNPRNIQLVSETNQALNYLINLYLKEGDCVIAEEPILPDNSSLIRNKGMKLVTVPMEEDGMDLKTLELLIKKHSPKFIYTLPNYHNPTGITMSLTKRLQLLEIAQRYGVPIIEEDSQRDFRYTENRIPSLYSLDKYKSVVYLDSFTLTFPYGIKTGYVVGPYDLAEMLGRCIVIDETFVSNMGQYMLNEYIEQGLWEEHTDNLASVYRERLNLLCEELDKIRHLGISFRKPQGGLVLWCDLDEEIKEKRLYQTAREKGLLIMPGFLFYPFGYQGNGHIRICFAKTDEAEIRRGVGILAEALEECSKKEEESAENE